MIARHNDNGSPSSNIPLNDDEVDDRQIVLLTDEDDVQIINSVSAAGHSEQVRQGVNQFYEGDADSYDASGEGVSGR